MNESILTSIKKLLGIDEQYEHFDQDLIIHINTVLMILNQIGIGHTGFFIQSKEETWEDFVVDLKNIQAVKTYVYLKVRLIFDPPLNSSIIESINRTLSELEWRLNITVDTEVIYFRDEFVTKKDFESNNTEVDKRFDAQNKRIDTLEHEIPVITFDDEHGTIIIDNK